MRNAPLKTKKQKDGGGGEKKANFVLLPFQRCPMQIRHMALGKAGGKANLFQNLRILPLLLHQDKYLPFYVALISARGEGRGSRTAGAFYRLKNIV